MTFPSTLQAAIYHVSPKLSVDCEEMPLLCGDSQGLILGGQYVGLVDTTGDFFPSANSIASAVFVELGWQFHQGVDIVANWLGQFKHQSHRFWLHDDRDTYFKDKHHIANIEVGKRVLLGPRAELRFLLGIQYMHVTRDAEAVAVASTDVVKQKFNGGGPRGGLEASFWMTPWLAVDGSVAVSALWGGSRVVSQRGVTLCDSSTQVVTPGVDGRLGIRLRVDQLGLASSRLPVEFVSGYRWYVYPKAMNNTFLFPDEPLQAGQGQFASHGFYLGLRMKLGRHVFL